MNKFKVGDRVRVIRKVEQESGWENGWVENMDAAIGFEYTIKRISRRTGVYLNINNRNYLTVQFDYGFPPSSLELVEDTMIDLNKKYRTVNKTEVVLHEIFDGKVFGRFLNLSGKWESCHWSVYGKLYINNSASTLDLVEVSQYEDFKIDDKVYAWWNDDCARKFKRYFAGVSKDGKPMTFYGGNTSWSAGEGSESIWDHCEKVLEDKQ